MPVENGEQNKWSNEWIGGTHQGDVKLAVDKQRGDQEWNAQKIPADYIKCGSQVAIPGEDPHIFIPQQVHKIPEGEEEKGDTNIKEVAIVYYMPSIPYDRKDTGSDDNGNPVSKTMEKAIVVPADKIEHGRCQHEEYRGPEFGLGNESIYQVLFLRKRYDNEMLQAMSIRLCLKWRMSPSGAGFPVFGTNVYEYCQTHHLPIVFKIFGQSLKWHMAGN